MENLTVSLSALLGFVWIVLVSIVALTPFPWHKKYALALLILFPVLLVLIAIDYGWYWSVAFFLAAASMYRRPLIYYIDKLRGRVE